MEMKSGDEEVKIEKEMAYGFAWLERWNGRRMEKMVQGLNGAWLAWLG